MDKGLCTVVTELSGTAVWSSPSLGLLEVNFFIAHDWI